MMSCYTRHLGEVMVTAGVDNTKENRKRIDNYLKEKYNLPQQVGSCPDLWKQHVKPMLSDKDKRMELAAEIYKMFNTTE